MVEYWYESFITKLSKYALLDGDGSIRATAPDLEGILEAKKRHIWGIVHKMSFDGKNLVIGGKVKG
mgnify:CR=1 FL=1